MKMLCFTHLTKCVSLTKYLWVPSFISSKIFEFQDVLVPLSPIFQRFGCGSKHCYIMNHVSSLGSKSKSLSS
jgi:hypothetical protein